MATDSLTAGSDYIRSRTGGAFNRSVTISDGSGLLGLLAERK